MTYRQITSGERYMLSALRKQGWSAAWIARKPGRAPSTISRGICRKRRNDGHCRPSKADSHSEVGHREIGTVMGTGSKGCIVTPVERKSGYTLIGKLPDRTKDELNKPAHWLIHKHHASFRTITADNGTEFHGYRELEARTGVLFYFANPHHSRQRGTNENTNGLIRQYLPRAPAWPTSPSTTALSLPTR